MSDLISREALIKDLRKDREAVYSYVFCHTDCQHEEELALDLEWFIENQPTIDAKEVVHGKWILEEKAGIDYWCCSECHKIKSEYYAKPKDNFCGNCGCDMRTSAE